MIEFNKKTDFGHLKMITARPFQRLDQLRQLKFTATLDDAI